jgi:PST family polysaccharide transporter
MNLFSGSVAGACAAIARLACGLLVVKVLAVYVGPAGTALVAQLQSVWIAATSIASGGFGAGIVKFSAEFRGDAERRRALLSTAFATTGIITALVSAILWFARDDIAAILLGDRSHAPAVGTLALCLFPIAANGVLLNVLIGHKAVLPYTVAIVGGSISAAAMHVWLAPAMGLQGALLAAAIAQAPILLVTVALAFRMEWFHLRDFLHGIDRRSLRMLANFSIMALATAVVVPASHIVIREFLSQAISPDAAGIWHGMSRISDVYLMVATQALTIYYLPRLAELSLPADLQREVLHGFRILVPVVAACAAVIYLLRRPAVAILFSEEFAPMEELFAFQLVGDVMKISGYIFAMLMLAKAMTRLYVITETVFAALFVMVSIACVNWFGLVGMAYGHAFLYAAYLATMMVATREVLRAGSSGPSARAG